MSTHTAPQSRAVPAPHTPAPPDHYCPIPQRLLTDLHDTPLAIGLYALVGRLYFVIQTPVPLSVPDVLRYDPTLSRGAVIRAFHRLVAGGWITEATERGRKSRYVPTWGRIKNLPHPWQIGQPCLGRPRHINRLALDRALLDICMGKLTPHQVLTAPITRYITTPALSLSDVGCYALSLAGLPRETPALRRLGLMRHGQTCPVPPDTQLLALISQQPLVFDAADSVQDTTLTISGTRKLGMVPASKHSTGDGQAQPLFFVPPELIGSMIGPMIGSMIGSTPAANNPQSAPAAPETRSDVPAPGITWESRESRESGNPPPTPPATDSRHQGGGGVAIRQTAQQPAPVPAQPTAVAPAPVIPDTATVRILRAINVLPEQLIELAELPVEVVQSAIADGHARPGIRDLAGWVVKLLRTQRDYGWQIRPPAPHADSPAALRAAFAQYAAEQGPVADETGSSPHADTAPPIAPPDSASSAGACLWEAVQAELRLRVSRQEFTTWIRPIALHSLTQGMATLLAPTPQIKAAIEGRYIAVLRDQLAQHTGAAVRVRIILRGRGP